MTSRAVLRNGALSAGVALVAIVAIRGARDGGEPSRCAPGLVALGPRCCGGGQSLEGGRCAGAPSSCAGSQRVTPEGCVPIEQRVAIAGGHLHIGPGDWEAQGVVVPHDADVAPFMIDAFEVTEERWRACVAASRCPEIALSGEPGRPVVGVPFDAARALCAHEGGRLPSRDELAFAIGGEAGRRYPWGDTGAVCRRAAWGLANGPCASGGTGPDLGGAHPDGRSREGVFDLAGNVAEWAESTDANAGFADAIGGAWRDTEAAALRGWNRRAVEKVERDPAVGVRCVYADP